MNRFTKLATLVALLSTSALAHAASPASGDDSRAVSLRLISSAVSKSCDDSTVVERSVTVCDTEGCSTRSLNDTSRLSFSIDKNRHSSFEVVASSYYKEGRVFRGDTVVDNFDVSAEATRFTQVIEGKNHCLMSFFYEVR